MNAIIFSFQLCGTFFLPANAFLFGTVKDIISEMKGNEIASFFAVVQAKGTENYCCLCAMCSAGN
jgi:hypothetical protein